jgi:hypothetical protein
MPISQAVSLLSICLTYDSGIRYQLYVNRCALKASNAGKLMVIFLETATPINDFGHSEKAASC